MAWQRRRGVAVTRIVVFHRIRDVKRFAGQVDFIRERASLVSLDNTLGNSVRADRLNACLVIDDGYADWVEAARVLMDRRIPATFYVCSGFVDAGMLGRGREFARTHLGLREPGEPLTWGDLRALAGTQGFRVGGHTRHHPLLADLSEAAIVEEIRADREVLEDRLGCAVVDFAYPFGHAASVSRVALVVAQSVGYRSGRTLIPGANTTATPPMALYADCLDEVEAGWLMAAWIAGAYDPVKRLLGERGP
jgi:peptidoglycan/xylan/chitin deacetylase (PgdA/CDA1 family)